MATPRWTPSPARAAGTALHAYLAHVRERHEPRCGDYDALHAWSVRDVNAFWADYVAWAGIELEGRWRRVASQGPMWRTRWFEGARLNLAQALLAGARLAPSGAEAVVVVDETGRREALDWPSLQHDVARARAALERDGVAAGDRVAVLAANRAEALVLFLACAALGAVFTSCSPDFGVEAARARFEQVTPTLLAASPAYAYGGRRFDVTATVAELCASLPGLRRLVWLPSPQDADALADAHQHEVGGVPALGWRAWRRARGGDGTPRYAALPFDHPLAVLYSSGTTGAPKAIAHRAGGVLLTHHKEHRLHGDVRPGDRVLYFTTLGWMMWNWLVSALAQGATVVLYDGSPTSPDVLALWRLAERERVSFFGTGARYLHALAAADARPGDAFDLSALRTVASTGSPLSIAGFAYVYERVKADVHLASISGGTDIVGCFALGVPTLSVHDGQLQRPGLGVDLAVFDDDGAELPPGRQGELVCRSALPSMPLGFWGDVDGARYRAAYFERFPGVWHHGDLVERTPEGGVIVHGRSDATLNPGGVRIGTAELYRPLEAVTEVLEACAVGRREGDDEEVWLLLVLREGATLDDELAARVRACIRAGASPRHVPARVLQVPALPQTRSGKPMELAVRQLVNGEPVGNRAVMVDPGVLERIAEALARQT